MHTREMSHAFPTDEPSSKRGRPDAAADAAAHRPRKVPTDEHQPIDTDVAPLEPTMAAPQPRPLSGAERCPIACLGLVIACLTTEELLAAQRVSRAWQQGAGCRWAWPRQPLWVVVDKVARHALHADQSLRHLRVQTNQKAQQKFHLAAMPGLLMAAAAHVFPPSNVRAAWWADVAQASASPCSRGREDGSVWGWKQCVGFAGFVGFVGFVVRSARPRRESPSSRRRRRTVARSDPTHPEGALRVDSTI